MDRKDFWPALGGLSALVGVFATVLMPIIMTDSTSSPSSTMGKTPGTPPGWISFASKYVEYVGPTILMVGVIILIYQFFRQRQKIAELLTTETCAFGGNCLVHVTVDLWPKTECNGLQCEIRQFLVLKEKKKVHQKSATEYMVRAGNLRENEHESWHVLYATPNAVSENYGGIHENWIANEDPLSRLRRKRIMVLSSDPLKSGEYDDKVKVMIERLSKTSQLKVIFETALVERNFSGLLRDFGVFRDRSSLNYEVLMSFGLCDYADVFSSMPGKSYSTNDQEYASRLVAAFEAAWTSADLRVEFEVARKIYGTGYVLA